MFLPYSGERGNGMANYADMIFAFIISFIFTFATTPLVRRFAYKIGAVDVPKDKRRVHKRPTPRIGGLAIILLYVLLLWRLFVVAVNAKDLFGSLICVGIMVHIAMQVLINIAVVTNTMPSTGIPLPFISYGGTSLVVLMAEMGIALSVSNRIEYER